MRIGRIFGIGVEVHWTLLLLLLFALALSGSNLLVFIVVVLLFVCVLVHELAHSVVALRNGVRVKEIILNVIGGASVIDTVGLDPNVEFRISVVGPLASLFLGGVFGMLVIFSGVGPLTYVLQFLFEINVLLGVFNILPAFPMDGGRVLRSWLRRTKNEYDATMTTVKISHWTTGAMIVAALIYVAVEKGSLVYKELDFFIFLIIAVFLYGGSQAEKESAVVKKETSGLKVRTLLSDSFAFVDSTADISQLYRIAVEKREHTIITRLNGRFMVVDPFRGRSGRAANIAELCIPAAVIRPSASLFDALSIIETSDSGVGVVANAGRIVGVVTSAKIQAFIYLHMLNKKRK